MRHKNCNNETSECDNSSTIISVGEAELQPGTVVACYLSKYEDEEPQIGKITLTDSDSDEIEVEWMVGTYSEPWQIWKQKQGRSYTTWKEKVPSTAVLFPVQFSSTERLSCSLIAKLKEAYEQRRSA